MSKDWKSIAKELRRQGWELTPTRNGHWRCVPPDRGKPIVHVSGTPSDRRAIDKVLGDLKRSGFRWVI